MSERTIFLRSLTIGVVAGLAVTVTSYVCTYASLKQDKGLGIRFTVMHDLMDLGVRLEEHRSKTGRLPERLEGMDREGLNSWQVNKSGRIVDVWGHPYVYNPRAVPVELVSLGRDGQRGGVGLDSDSSVMGRRIPDRPTLWQFTFVLDTGSIQLCCTLAGLMVAVVCIRERLGAPGYGFLALTTLPPVFVTTVWATWYMLRLYSFGG